MDKLLGGPLLPTLLKLAIASVVVGIVLAVFGIRPIDLWRDFIDTFVRGPANISCLARSW